MVMSYQFKNEKTWHKMDCNQSLQVFEIKKYILSRHHITNGNGLILQNAITGEQYSGDKSYVPHNASLLIRRIPKHSLLNAIDLSVKKPIKEKIIEPKKEDEEEKKVLAILNHSSEYLHKKNINKSVVYERQPTNKKPQKTFTPAGTTPPPNYTCHRCKAKGHYIQHCSTNGDPAFDIKVFKHPTGIPKMFLKVCKDESADHEQIFKKDDVAFYTNPNKRSFEKVYSQEVSEQVSKKCSKNHFKCPICECQIKNAFLLSCCFMSFCEECVHQLLIDEEAMCPICDEYVTRENLFENKALRKKIISINN